MGPCGQRTTADGQRGTSAGCRWGGWQEGKMKFRVGQKVCKVDWRAGEPFFQFGRVTRTTTQTYYVDKSKRPEHGWFTNSHDAFCAEYEYLCRMWAPIFGRKPNDWTIEDTVQAIVSLRRLQRRMRKRSHEPTSNREGTGPTGEPTLGLPATRGPGVHPSGPAVPRASGPLC